MFLNLSFSAQTNKFSLLPYKVKATTVIHFIL